MRTTADLGQHGGSAEADCLCSGKSAYNLSWPSTFKGSQPLADPWQHEFELQRSTELQTIKLSRAN